MLTSFTWIGTEYRRQCIDISKRTLLENIYHKDNLKVNLLIASKCNCAETGRKGFVSPKKFSSEQVAKKASPAPSQSFCENNGVSI